MSGLKIPPTNASILGELENMKEKEDGIEEDIKEVRRAIYGFNGTPGLLSDVTILKKMMADIRKLAWAVVLVVLGILIAAVWSLIISHPPGT